MQQTRLFTYLTTFSIVCFIAYIALLCFPYTLTHESGIIIISGASTGIGRSAAEAISRKYPKYTVFAGVRKEIDKNSLSEMGLQNLIPIFLDVTSSQSVLNALQSVETFANEKKLDIISVINNAGIAQGPTTVEFHQISDAETVFNVNYFGALRLTQAFLPLLRRTHGRVIMISSITGEFAPPMGGIYSSSKHALEALSDSLRVEVNPLGVSVSIIQPGAVLTPIFKTLAPESIESAINQKKEAISIYPHLYTRQDVMNEKILEELAADVSVTNKAILHALTSSRPLTRYRVANMLGVPSFLFVYLSLLPDRLVDLFLSFKTVPSFLLFIFRILTRYIPQGFLDIYLSFQALPFLLAPQLSFFISHVKEMLL